MAKHANMIANRDNDRSQYIPDNKTCNTCEKEFDFNKEYPAGSFGDTKNVVCYKCKTSRKPKKKV
jgi:hypothetical protein